MRSVSDWEGEAFFVDAPELVKLAQQKIDRPLFAVVLRVAAKGPSRTRAWQIAKRLGGALAQVGTPSGNESIALANDDYPDEQHLDDLLGGETHRSGFLVNSEELVSLVHLPSAVVRAPRLTREQRRVKAAPAVAVGHPLLLGENTYGEATRNVSLSTEHRLRHTHIVGASGTGKSTLLLRLIVQDMEQGQGIAVLDPHGDLVDQVLAYVPEKRLKDVILVDPADVEYPVGFSILSAHSELEKTLLSSDLVAVFRRLSTSWDDQVTSVMSNAALAFLESEHGGTLADLHRFLVVHPL